MAFHPTKDSSCPRTNLSLNGCSLNWVNKICYL